MHRWRALTFLALTAALTVAALWRPPAGMPSACMSKNLFGVSCPGCGMTRSLTATAHGDLAAAFRFHAFGPFALAGAVVAWALLGAGLITGKDYLPDISQRGWSWAIVGSFVLLIVYWIIRLATHSTP